MSWRSLASSRWYSSSLAEPRAIFGPQRHGTTKKNAPDLERLLRAPGKPYHPAEEAVSRITTGSIPRWDGSMRAFTDKHHRRGAEDAEVDNERFSPRSLRLYR
jgi:hypothetical protein